MSAKTLPLHGLAPNVLRRSRLGEALGRSQLAVRQGAKGGADFVSSKTEETDSLGQGRPADALKVVERGGAFDVEALVLAEQNLGRDIAHGSGDGRDDDAGEHGDGLAARDH